MYTCTDYDCVKYAKYNLKFYVVMFHIECIDIYSFYLHTKCNVPSFSSLLVIAIKRKINRLRAATIAVVVIYVFRRYRLPDFQSLH
jgi:hypothetical protein